MDHHQRLGQHELVDPPRDGEPLQAGCVINIGFVHSPRVIVEVGQTNIGINLTQPVPENSEKKILLST